jgi:hypothetical protein
MSKKVVLKKYGISIGAGEDDDGAWTDKVESTGLEQLFVRVVKLRGIRNTHDPFSPIVVFSFMRGSLFLHIQGANVVPGHVNGLNYVLNPYLNEPQTQWPSFRIPVRALRSAEYNVSDHTGRYGDFIVLESRDHSKPHRLIINLSALGMLSGLTEISLDGEFVFYRKRVGKLSRAQFTTFPVVENCTARDPGPTETALASLYFQSHALLLHPSDTGSPLVRHFEYIDWCVHADRGTMPFEEGVAKCRATFAKLFTCAQAGT